MNRKPVLFCGLLFLSSLSAPAWEPPDRLWPKPFLGRDFWTIMWDGDFYADPHPGRTPPESLNPELKRHPLFNDCGHYSSSGRGATSGSNHVWRTVRENYVGLSPESDAAWEAVRPINDGKPYVITLQNKRLDARQLVGPVDLDYADYAAFTNSLPNLLGFNMLSEWANDVGGIENRMKKIPDEETREAIRREWLDTRPGKGESPFPYLKRFVDRRLALYYNDWSKCKVMSSCARYDHWTASWGCPVVEIETSASTGRRDTEYRWDYGSMITRGAARQFGIQWAWYYALYLNGWTHDGQWKNDSHCNLTKKGREADTRGEVWNGSRGGVSPSVLRRALYFGYLTGANYCQFESRSALTTIDPATGKDILSPMGEHYAGFHAFTRAHPDRGCLFTPAAILAPTLLGIRSFGGIETDSAFMVDAFLFTLYPGWKRAEGLRQGREGYLHASRFPSMCDYLVADSTQSADRYLEALRAYPIAILAGDHAPDADIAAPLKTYVAEGGKLVVNAVYLTRAGFGADFTGVSWDGSAVTNGAQYAIAQLKLDGARTVKSDPDGQVIATAFTYGRGQVIVMSPLRMTPRRAGTDHVPRMLAGDLKFPYVEWIYDCILAKYYPVQLVSGNVSWGLNRTKTGWWLWALNNRGVTKFADTLERIDPAATEEVVFDIAKLNASAAKELVSGRDFRLSGSRLSAVIPAGDLVVFELK